MTTNSSGVANFVLISITITGLACILLGIVGIAFEYHLREQATRAASSAASAASRSTKDVAPDGLAEQSELSDAVESIAKLGDSLKGLEPSSRLLVIGVALLTIATVGVSVGVVAQAT